MIEDEASLEPMALQSGGGEPLLLGPSRLDRPSPAPPIRLRDAGLGLRGYRSLLLWAFTDRLIHVSCLPA